MTFKFVTATVLAFALAAPALAADDFMASPAAIRGHMEFLASDLLEGREAGARGYDIAASYVAARFTELGLKPAGVGGSYMQPVPLVSYRPAQQGAMTIRGRRSVRMVFGEDFLPSASPLRLSTQAKGELVLAGYGVSAPERGIEDYEGLDVKGKIVVVLQGAPKSLPSEERAYYMSRRLKLETAARRGAIGLIMVQTPSYERVGPFSRSADQWKSWSMTWQAPDGRAYFPGVQPLGSLSLKGAAKLFADAPMKFDAVVAAAEDGKAPRFPLGSSATISFLNEVKALKSVNVAGLLEGSDAKLKDEVVVLSAHLDHVGLGAPQKGDGLYNGAMDNAAGIASMLEVARGLVGEDRPKRSVLFLAVTAEEKGLIGAEYYARNPTLPKPALVANVNLDMPLLSYAFSDITAFGADRSSLGPSVERAARRMGVSVTPDPNPDAGIFTRSDHFRFVEQGVPSVFLATGQAGPGKAAWESFLRDRYHQPGDDLAQTIDYDAGARFAQLNYEITREIADAPRRPLWKAGDFFATRFGGRMAAAD